MATTIEKIYNQVDQFYVNCKVGTKIALKDNSKMYRLASKTAIAAALAGLVSIAVGMNPIGALTIAAIVGAGIFCYTVNRYGSGEGFKGKLQSLWEKAKEETNNLEKDMSLALNCLNDLKDDAIDCKDRFLKWIRNKR